MAVLAVLGHQLGQHPGEFGRHGRVQRPDVRRRLLLVLKQLLQNGPAGERRLAAEHVEQRAAERIQVAPNVDVARVARLLGTDVVERPQRHPGLGQPDVGLPLESSRQPHVDQLRPPLRRQDDVRRLDVAMDHPAIRRVDERLGDLKRDVHRFIQGQGAVEVHLATDRHPLDVLEDDVVVGPVLAQTVHPRDVLVVELGGRSALLIEPLDDLGVVGLVGRQELERDFAVELGVVRAEDGAHPAGPDRFLKHERVDDLAGLGQRDRRPPPAQPRSLP